MHFTLFVILPNEDVCSLRHLTSGISIGAVRSKLELSAGLPAQIYCLTSPEGQLLAEDLQLKLDSNVWDGFIMRAIFLDSWQELYDNILANDVQQVMQQCIEFEGNGVKSHADDKGKERAHTLTQERGVAALFVASFLGMTEMCRALLTLGVNPNGKTPFGRTPLFAGMSQDNVAVMELLLSNGATLESRDREGAIAVDIARLVAAKRCLRKVRPWQFQNKVVTILSATASASSPRDPLNPSRTKTEPRIIRIPTETAPKAETPISSEWKSSHPPATARPEKAEPAERRPMLCAGKDCHPPSPSPSPDQVNGKMAHDFPGNSNLGQSTILFRQNRDKDLYRWSDVPCRTSCSAVSHERSSELPGDRRQVTSEGGRRGSQKGQEVTWSDDVLVSSRSSPSRSAVRTITVKGPNSVLTTSSFPSRPHTGNLSKTADSPEAGGDNEKPPKPSALLRYSLQQSAPALDAQTELHQIQDTNVPAQEPPGRPPSLTESTLLSPRMEGDRHLLPGSLSKSSTMGSLKVQSIDRPGSEELEAEYGGDRKQDVQIQPALKTASRDNRGRQRQSSHSSPGIRARRPLSRVQRESWRTIKLRLRLAEDQKRSGSRKSQQNAGTDREGKTESFQQWLEKKRREERRKHSSREEDTSSDDDDHVNASGENSQAFNDWLKDLKERPLRRPHTTSPASLHRRKTRPLQNLIQIDCIPVPAPDPDTYVTAYREWQQQKRCNTANGDHHPQGTILNIKEAKRRLEEKRKSMLATALTYEDWLEHIEERRKLMKAVLHADLEQLSAAEKQIFLTRRAPRQITFDHWREGLANKNSEVHRQKKKEAVKSKIQTDGEGQSTWHGNPG